MVGMGRNVLEEFECVECVGMGRVEWVKLIGMGSICWKSGMG
jgi:hypothetical protein